VRPRRRPVDAREPAFDQCALTLTKAGPSPLHQHPNAPADLAAEVATLVEGGTSTRDAVTAVAEATGTPRRSVYQAVLDARGEHR